MTHQVYITPASVKAREEYVRAKYDGLSYVDKVSIDQQAERLHQHFVSRNFKPEPSFLYKIDLLFMVGTWLNENRA
jgi:hypothetical protein